jgi:subtilase family serine protease
VLAIILLSGFSSFAQTNISRVGEVDSNQRIVMPGTKHPLANAANMVGHADPSTALTGVKLYFKPSPAQQAELTALLAAQQNPASPSFHKWLTTAQFTARFGLSSDDTDRISQWLTAQGLTVTGATPTRISFSGDAAHIEAALQTQINRYRVYGSDHLANGTEISLPSAIANVTIGVGNLAGFRPRPRLRLRPRYDFGSTGDHFLAPDDFTTIYDVKPLYSAGFTGSGEIIAVVGQSEILASDVAAFRTASGLAANAPTLTLVPDSGTAAFSSEDEQESDLDVEWSGAIAENAAVNFIYVGNNTNYSVFDSLQYAIENDVAPVISISYGACEASWSSSDVAILDEGFEQANAQGQTVVAASGDDGAADCDDSETTTVTVAKDGLAVDLPAASPYVTGIGGTEFLGDVSSSGTYWNSSNDSSNGSAKSYIPEEGWNDTDETTNPSNGLAASGGGKSILFGKPSWQAGTGVPADGARDVPDIALNASPQHDGYLFCNEGSCSNGFLDSTGEPTVAGGTSFGAPTFTGILTLILDKLSSSGQGNINPEIYALAASTPAAFHDITTGNNQVPCASGSPDCGSSGVIGYTAGTGYDQVTGWGSVDANALATAFAGFATPTPATTTTNLMASTTTPTLNTQITFTATVSPVSGTTVPTGTIQFAVDGTSSGSPVTLASGGSSSYSPQATFSTTFSANGSHTITATYSGDSANAASSNTLIITIGSTTTGTQSFTLSATSVTIAQGGSGTSTITVTPAGGYTGTVGFTVSGPSNLADTCYSVASAIVTGTPSVSSTLTINTTEAACATPSARRITVAGMNNATPGRRAFDPRNAWALVLLPFATLARFRRRRWSSTACVVLLAMAGLVALSGCGGGSSTTTVEEAAKGTYTLTVTGTDSTTTTLTNSTTLTLTIN